MNTFTDYWLCGTYRFACFLLTDILELNYKEEKEFLSNIYIENFLCTYFAAIIIDCFTINAQNKTLTKISNFFPNDAA